MSEISQIKPDVGSEIYLVGDLRVEVRRQLVTQSGVEITLPNLSFQLLLALIRGAPDVVSYDKLMASVWPGLVVSPETLNKRANLLREALGDQAKQPRYIAGVRGRGYRLIADVTRTDGAATHDTAAKRGNSSGSSESETASPQASVVGKRTLHKKTRVGLWLGLLVVLVAVGITARTVFKAHGSLGASKATSTSQEPIAPRNANARTVAVLPFENISADASDAYLARGLPEMLLSRLSRVGGLTVIARNSAFALASVDVDSREIGRLLNSHYLVQGSVQRRADRLRVTVQLVDATSGTQIWSAHFDRAVSAIFEVQDEIADQVTGALSERVDVLETKTLPQAHSSNIEAYLAYLRGRTLLGRLSVAESEAAAPLFQRAIELDPGFSAAYASLYDARMQAADLRHQDLAGARRRYHSLIDRALAIDPTSGSAYFARAMWSDESFETRNADFKRGVTLDPSNGRGLTAYAEFLNYEDLGWAQAPRAGVNYPPRYADAQRILQRSLQVDPMSPAAHFDAATMTLGEDGAAVVERNMQAVLELDPDFLPALYEVGKYRWIFHGKLAEAAQILEHAIRLDPANPEPRHTAMGIYLDLGEEQMAREVAAGTPTGAHDTHLQLMHAGDWRAAGVAAYEDSGWVTVDYCANWLAAEALRDYALKTGELGRAISFIESKYEFGDDPSAHIQICNSAAAIPLSQLLAAQGHASEAQALRSSAMAWSNAHFDKYGATLGRTRATAILLEGQRDAALDALTEDFQSGDYLFWWYTLKYDPVWVPLHSDPRFRAIAADVQRFIDNQRTLLMDLRRHGIVPDTPRGGDSNPKPNSQSQ
jgi:TolB-like protein/DNA-binding winged helix-turn-helix (wHTH) protein